MKSSSQITEELNKKLSLEKLILLLNEHSKNIGKCHEPLIRAQLKELKEKFEKKLLAVKDFNELKAINEELTVIGTITNQEWKVEFERMLTLKGNHTLKELYLEVMDYLKDRGPREQLLRQLKEQKFTEAELESLQTVPARKCKSTKFAQQFNHLEQQIEQAIVKQKQEKIFEKLMYSIIELKAESPNTFQQNYQKAKELCEQIDTTQLSKEQLSQFTHLEKRLQLMNKAEQRWMQLAEFRTHMDNIDKEKNKLDKNSIAYRDADTLHKALSDFSQNYVDGIMNLPQFKKEAKNSLVTAEQSALKDIHSWKEIFVNIILAIASIPTLGLMYTIPAISKCTLFPVKINAVTDEVESLQKNMDTMNDLGM